MEQPLEQGPGGTVINPALGGTPSTLPEPGQQFGHYQIVRRLGAGGMGTVFEAEDLDTGRRIALKILGQALDSPEARQRFLREGRLAASINHPNSVYVFGTEEISGTPVISMELVSGGTLQRQVAERGPLPPAEAVDYVLQLIAGLEAAQQIGILHRDIKPSNCFIDANGTVKIGDFGLSLSTGLRTDASLTATGMYLGTPAFSSPEQLRGQELTVRSDIYAVGVTLYFLLTGRLPFHAPNMVQMLANVLEGHPESPARIRAGIPKGLCQAVLKCLEKDAGERFKSYHELRHALAPYSSTAPNAAALGLRFLAGVADTALIGVTVLLVAVLLGAPAHFLAVYGQPTKEMFFAVIGMMLVMLAYYGILEGLWGASVGKAICGLRLVGPERNPPGIPKALARAAMFLFIPVLPYWIYMGTNPLESIAQGSQFSQFLMSALVYALVAAFFVTARRKNGFAAVHDLLTRTRVVRTLEWETRPGLNIVELQKPVPEGVPAIGPFHVIETLEEAPGEKWLHGYDVRLLRKVLLHVVPPGTPSVPPQLRNVSRPGRLRWLGGRRSPGENWDAYEGLSGKPLLALCQEPQPWCQVRYWMLDLAGELSLAQRDGTVPAVLDLDRVWITSDGRAKLLDFPVPTGNDAFPHAPLQANPTDSPPPPPSPPQFARFMHHVAHTALAGKSTGQEPELKSPAVPLPLHARAFLESLSLLPDVEAIEAALRPMVRRVAEISRLRRAGTVLACLAVPLLATAGMLFGFQVLEKMQQSNPKLMELSNLLQIRRGTKMSWAKDKKAPDDRTFGIYIAHHYPEVITNQQSWTRLFAVSLIQGENRRFAEQSVSEHRDATAEEIQRADKELGPYVERMDAFNFTRKPWMPFAVVSATLIIYVGLPAIVAALAFRGGLVMLGFGLALVKKNGERASRLRTFWRSLLAWAPVFAAPILTITLVPMLGTTWAIAIPLLLLAALTITSVLLPQRGLQDRLAGTYPVPR